MAEAALRSSIPRERLSTSKEWMDSRFRGNDGGKALIPCSAGACPPPPSAFLSFPSSDAGYKPALPEDADEDEFPAPHGGGRTRESTGEERMDSRFRGNDGDKALIPCSAGACPPPPSALIAFPPSDAGCKPASTRKARMKWNFPHCTAAGVRGNDGCGGYFKQSTSRHSRESACPLAKRRWIPAFAGMTAIRR